MKINLTKKQYESLAKAVYLGNWIANAQRTGSPDDPQNKEYRNISEYIFSFAKDFGFGDNFEAELEFSDSEEESEVSKLHEEYDERNLFDILPDMLGERDLFKKYSKKEIGEMTQIDYLTKLYKCINVWNNEFEKHGVDRLSILK